jgi:hypothetical protein
MIIKAQIERCELLTITDKDDETKQSRLWQLTLSDKTIPASYRCKDTFTTYLSDDKKEALEKHIPGLIDERVTFLLTELEGGSRGNVKCRGTVIAGWLDEKQLAALAAPQSAPFTTEISRPEPKQAEKPAVK